MRTIFLTHTHQKKQTNKQRNQYKYFNFWFCFSSFVFFLCKKFAVHRPLDIKNRPRIPIPDEDPYSIAGNGGGSGSSGSSGFGNSNSAPGLYTQNSKYTHFTHITHIIHTTHITHSYAHAHTQSCQHMTHDTNINMKYRDTNTIKYKILLCGNYITSFPMILPFYYWVVLLLILLFLLVSLLVLCEIPFTIHLSIYPYTYSYININTSKRESERERDEKKVNKTTVNFLID